MRYEVEQKYPVADAAALVAKLEARGVRFEQTVGQSDQYLAHPARDFSQTDEALRIRSVGDKSFVTYKGPKIDKTTKTRREIELPLAGDPDGSQFGELLAALGFSPVAVVRKRRRTFHLPTDGADVEGAIDQVDGVGTFVELELQSDEAQLERAKATIAALAIELGLGQAERRSYLEMLLENRS